jgi:glycolate oxidase
MAVSTLIAAGIIPAALEMMDQTIVEAVEAAFGFGFPRDAGAVLILELDGLEAGLDAQAERAIAICREHGARDGRSARDAAERERLWLARKKAVGAVGRLAPSKVTQDGVIPRTKLPEVLERIAAIAARHDLRIANVFHAGDGNLHPIVLFDERDPEQVRRVLDAGAEILDACLDAGGSISGEHGIGLEKRAHMARMFSPADLAAMQALRDALDPERRMNPGKLLPMPGGCREGSQPAAPGGSR